MKMENYVFLLFNDKMLVWRKKKKKKMPVKHTHKLQK